jgi:hypothetical protein
MDIKQLRADTRFQLGNITSTEYSDLNLDRQIDKYYKKAIEIALSSSGEWEVSGEIATTNIISGQQEYVLTTDTRLLTLKRIEINTAGGTNTWQTTKIIDMRNIERALSNDVTTFSNRPEVRLYDNSIFLMEKPTSSVTGGIKIYFSKEKKPLSLQAVVEEDTNRTLTMSGILGTNGLVVTLSQNTTDVLSITNPSSTSLLIKLADTTDSKNTVALIQSGLRALGVSNGMDFSNAFVEGNNWEDITGATITTATDTFDITDTALGVDVPDLPTSVQDYLVKGAVFEYASSFGLTNKRNESMELLQQLKSDIELHYSNKLTAKRPQLTFKQYNLE